MSGLSFPPLDPASYAWKSSTRRALAAECMWVARPKECHALFLGCSLELRTPIPRRELEKSAKSAWQFLLFEVPELCMDGVWRDESPYLQSIAYSNAVEAHQWADRTLSFGHGKRKLDFQELRAQRPRNTLGHESDRAFLFLNAVIRDGSEQSDQEVSLAQIMLYADHQIADGIGLRILLGKYLAILASTLAKLPGSPAEELNWEASSENLTQPWILLMNEDQVTEGPRYEALLQSNTKALLQTMSNNPGLPLASTLVQPVTQKQHFITLSASQTSALLQAIKQVMGPESNITHLGHAAMVLAMLRANPAMNDTIHSSSGPTALCSPCWLNGRRYLRCPADEPTPLYSFIPICQSFAPLVIDLQELTLTKDATQPEVKQKLTHACSLTTAEYRNLKAKKSIMPEAVALMEFVGRSMNGPQRIASTDSSTVPVAATTADPFFLSDGITEQYIAHKYYDHPIESSTGTEVFEIDDVQFAANAEQNLIVRMNSWKGRTTISGEWRDCDYDGDMIVRFLEDLVAIMMIITEE